MANIPIKNFMTNFDILGFKDMVKNNDIYTMIKKFEDVFVDGIKKVSRVDTPDIKIKAESDGKVKLVHSLIFSDTVLLFTDVSPHAAIKYVLASIVDLLLVSSWSIGCSIWNGFLLRGSNFFWGILC